MFCISPSQTVQLLMYVLNSLLLQKNVLFFNPKLWNLVYSALLLSFLFLAEPLPFTPGGGKSFIMGSDDMLERVLGLGDLADLTVSNDEAEYSYDVSTPLLFCFNNNHFWH